MDWTFFHNGVKIWNWVGDFDDERVFGPIGPRLWKMR